MVETTARKSSASMSNGIAFSLVLDPNWCLCSYIASTLSVTCERKLWAGVRWLFRRPSCNNHAAGSRFNDTVMQSADDTVLAMIRRVFVVKIAALLAVVLCAAGSACGQEAAATEQTETDEYTRYELLTPESGSFAIRYEVTATTTGAKYYFNPIRKGSVASGESVVDVMTGLPLRFEVVSGEDAVKDSLMKGEDASENYIKVYLARPVPLEGQARLLILKTYKDAKSYFREGDAIVFKRLLGVPRNSVVLPAGYELVACNVPSQVLTEADGRIAVSFLNGIGAEAPLVVKGRLGAQTGVGTVPRKAGSARSWESPFEGETEQERLSERAHEDREIVYFLQQPETHAFRLYHDYTEIRPGVGKYFNVVRTGSKVSDPSAYVLDTGEKLADKNNDRRRDGVAKN